MVPAWNSDLIHGNYRLLSTLSQLQSLFFFFISPSLPFLSDSLRSCTITLASASRSSDVWPPSPPFSHHFLLLFHLLVPRCPVSSHHRRSPLASVLCSCFPWQPVVSVSVSPVLSVALHCRMLSHGRPHARGML